MNLNGVKTILTIDGKPCHFVHLSLHQSFNKHSSFEIKIDYEELDVSWMANPIQMIKLMGKDVNITMTQLITGETNLFKGIITDVSINGQNGEQNYITVIGCSPTIKLDGTPTMDSFMDLDLSSIAKEAVESSGNGATVDIKPVFKGKIDYICQYDETAFQFLNRLSWLYGEWFFYDGTTIHFGKPDVGDPTILTYDKEISHFDLRAKLVPPKVKRYDYLTHDVNEVNSEAPETVDGVRGYIKVALDESSKVYTSNAVRPLQSSILTKKELDDLVKVDKYRMVSQMLTMHAKTKTCKVKIGKLVSVNLPSSMQVTLKHVETFLVTDLVHEIDQDGTYFNTFSGIPSEMENIPMEPIAPPKTASQVAWVKTNADPKGRGRVQVQLQWQKQLNKTTNWIRVQTPDGGSSDKVANNRGFVFVPEEGDQVMVGFEYGDPNRPYITGAIFPENVSTGGGQGNKSKSLTSRSGSTVTLDDNQGKGSITISDPSGNVVVMDGAGNVTITAPNTMTLNAKDIKINADNTIELNAEASISIKAQTSVDVTATSDGISLAATQTLDLKSNGADVSITASTDLSMNAADITASGSGSINMSSGDTNIM